MQRILRLPRSGWKPILGLSLARLRCATNPPAPLEVADAGNRSVLFQHGTCGRPRRLRDLAVAGLGASLHLCMQTVGMLQVGPVALALFVKRRKSLHPGAVGRRRELPPTLCSGQSQAPVDMSSCLPHSATEHFTGVLGLRVMASLHLRASAHLPCGPNAHKANASLRTLRQDWQEAGATAH